MTSQKLYIIIPHWGNTLDFLKTAVDSIVQLQNFLIQIIIVDNASPAAVTPMFLQKYPDLVLITNQKNRGWAGACNIGIKYAMTHNADIILLLNNDVKISNPHLISTLIHKYFSSINRSFIVGVRVQYSDVPDKMHNSGWFLFKNTNKPFNKYRLNYKDQFSTHCVDYVSGCFMMFSSDVVDKIGLLDEKYFMYADDADYCLRAWKKGIAVVCDAEFQIFHQVSSSYGENSPFVWYYKTRNQWILLKNFLDKKEFHYFRWKVHFNNLKNMIKIIFYPRYFNNYFFKRIVSTYHGMIDGYNNNIGERKNS